MKTTVQASSDVALIKYWGKKDEVLRLPENGSISIILSGLDTVTTVEFRSELERDDVTIQGEQDAGEVSRVIAHLDRIRSVARTKDFATVASQNVFPKGTGLSSSGSGFAALTIAATKALGLNLSQKELSILSRQGSGTACRCVCGGFVEWRDGNTSEESFSETLFPASYWDIRDVVAIVDEEKKSVSSTEGHQSAQTGPFFQARQSRIQKKIKDLQKTIQEKDFTHFGEIIEAESLEFHSILLTSTPPLLAWYPGTIQVMQEVAAMRKEGIQAYTTINTGFNVHVLTLPKYEKQVEIRLLQLPLVQKTLHATVGTGPRILTHHLF